MKSPSVFIVPALFALLSACGQSPAPPLTGANARTQVLDASSRALLTSYDPASGNMTYAAGSPTLGALTPGDIVAAEPSPAAPYGYLRKVTSVSVAEGIVRLETQQASLEDAVDTGTLTASREITVADLSGPIETSPGVTVSSGLASQQLSPQGSASKNFNFTFDNLLFDADNNPATTDDQVRVSGSMNVDMRLDLNVDIHKQLGVPTGLDSALAAVTLDEHSQLAFSGQYNGHVSREISLGSASFNAFTFFIAGVPVTVSPGVVFVLSTDGTVSAKLKLRAVHDFQAQVGASYTAADGWKNLNSLTNTFTTDPPEYGGTMNGRAYAGADFSLGFYAKSPSIFGLPELNLAGAAFQAKGRAYAGLDADLKRNPQWKVYAGVTADVGINASVLSRQVANYTTRVLDFQRELSSGNPAALADPGGFTASAGSVGSIDLRWNAVSGATGYLIERRAGTGAYTELNRPGATSIRYTDAGLTPGTAYSYRLHTLGNGLTSTGVEASATTPSLLPAPATFTADGPTPTDITLRWSAVSGAGSYLLERRSGTGGYTELARPTAGTTEYGDGGLSPATTYSYRLRAVGSNGTGKAIEATATTRATTVLPVIGNPSPASLSLTAPVNGFATANVTYSNLGGGTLTADASPGSGWLSVVSNTPRPLAPGATATVSLKATCPATAGVLSTNLIITANDSRIPSKPVNVSLTCTAAAPLTTLGLGVTSVGGQSVPPYGTTTNPAVVSGTISIVGYVQAGANPVTTVQAFVIGNPVAVGEKAVAVAAGVRQNTVTQADLDTTALPNNIYTFFVRAIDSAGASADSSPVTVRVNNTSSTSAASEIRQITTANPPKDYLVNPGESPVPLSGTTKVFARLYGGSNGYNGNVYLCLQRGNPANGSSNTSVGVQAANIQSGAVYDFGYSWDTPSSGNTPSGQFDNLFLSGSSACDSISNPATTSVIRVTVNN